jgi:general secretion pathway protein H
MQAMIVWRNIPAPPPISARHAGFTLLEILVVIVIFGVLISLATLSIGSFSDNDLSEHSRRLETLIGLALEEAEIQNREIGLLFYQHGYEFSARVTEQDEDGNLIWVWLPLDEDRIFKSRDLSEDTAIDLEIEGKEVTLEYERDTEETYAPQIFLLSSGDIQPPFNVRVRPTYKAEGVMLEVNEFGAVERSYEEF